MKTLEEKAKAIILAGAKEVGIELKEFQVDINSDTHELKFAIEVQYPKACLVYAFYWGESGYYWWQIYQQLPTKLKQPLKF